MSVNTCEYVGCNREGWAVLHFGPRLTPPLRVVCREHASCGDLTAFRDAAAPTHPADADVVETAADERKS